MSRSWAWDDRRDEFGRDHGERPALSLGVLQIVQDSINLAHLGRLYYYRAVESEKLCPTGSHVSTEDEWGALIEEFGGDVSWLR